MTRIAVMTGDFMIASTYVQKKGGKDRLSPGLQTAVYCWNAVVMLLVLLASFASPKWH